MAVFIILILIRCLKLLRDKLSLNFQVLRWNSASSMNVSRCFVTNNLRFDSSLIVIIHDLRGASMHSENLL